VYKKMLKGRTNEEIAEEAEEDIDTVEYVKEAIFAYRKESGSDEFDAGKVVEYLGRM